MRRIKTGLANLLTATVKNTSWMGSVTSALSVSVTCRARLVLLCILLVSQRLPLFTSMQHLQHRLRGPPTNPNQVVVRAPRAQSLRCRAAAAPADTASSTASALQSDIIRLSGSKYGHDLSAETRAVVSVVDRRYSICEAAVGGGVWIRSTRVRFDMVQQLDTAPSGCPGCGGATW